jgi:hypothetical protein
MGKRNRTSTAENVQNRNGRAGLKETTTQQPKPQTPEPLPSPAKEPDPFDPATFSVPQTFRGGAKPVITEVAVRTPDGEWYVRCHPDPIYTCEGWFIETKVEPKGVYHVNIALHDYLRVKEKSAYKRKRLVLSVNAFNELFFWPLRLPDDDNDPLDKWSDHALQTVERAKTEWLRMYWDRNKRTHDIKVGEFEQEPFWPPSDLSMRDLLKIAFSSRYIDKVDHPVLQRLEGKAAR